MGASNGARSTCCLPKPPGFKASGRRFGKSVASYVRAKSRRTASGRSHSRGRLSRLQLAAAASPRRCWASIAIIGGSRSCIETRTSSSARTATRIVATTLLERFSLTGFVLKILKSVAPSPTRAIEHFQDDRNRAIRSFSGFNRITLRTQTPSFVFSQAPAHIAGARVLHSLNKAGKLPPITGSFPRSFTERVRQPAAPIHHPSRLARTASSWFLAKCSAHGIAADIRTSRSRAQFPPAQNASSRGTWSGLPRRGRR